MKEVYLQNTLSVCLVAANSELSPIVTSAAFSLIFSAEQEAVNILLQ